MSERVFKQANRTSPPKKTTSVLTHPSQLMKLQRMIGNQAVGRLISRKANNTGMPDNLKSGVEALSGISMDDVRVHYNSSKPAELNALSYSQGSEIHVAPGAEKHLPHEMWHVVQQKQGRVSATVQIQGSHVNTDKALETEADTMGAKAAEASTAPAPDEST